MKNDIMFFGLSISTYALIFLLGVVGMIVMNCIRGKKKNIKLYDCVAITIGVVAISFLGAKILFYLERPNSLITDGIRFDGFSFYGALFLVPVLMIIVAKLFRADYYKFMDFVSPSLMLILTVLRFGCFLSGCCGGVTVVTSSSTYVFPVQIVECVIDIGIMFGLLLYEKHWETIGRLYFFIMAYYGVFRFFLEFMRDTTKDWLGFSHGQCFSVISVCIGGYMLYYLGKLDKKKKKKKHYK